MTKLLKMGRQYDTVTSKLILRHLYEDELPVSLAAAVPGRGQLEVPRLWVRNIHAA